MLKLYPRPSTNRSMDTPILIPTPIHIHTHTSRLLRKATCCLLVTMAVLLSPTPTPASRISPSISSKTSSTYKPLPRAFFALHFLRCKCITSLTRMLMLGAIVLIISLSTRVISTQTLRMDPALGSCVVYTLFSRPCIHFLGFLLWYIMTTRVESRTQNEIMECVRVKVVQR